MSLQTENRNQPELGRDDDKLGYQRFEHPSLKVLQFAMQAGAPDAPFGKLFPASVRIYCPDIRVVSRIAVVFQPQDPNDRIQYNLSELGNTIVAYRCINARSRIARVGEIVGKAGVPLMFPKSDIDGIAFQSDDDMPWIDVEMNLGFPGVPGTWELYYHATSNNKLKKLEWEGYINRVTMSVQSSAGLVKYHGDE